MKLLYVTSLSGRRINGFMRSAIIAARELEIDFTMACNMDMADKEGYADDCKNYGIRTVHIDFDRNPLGKKNKTAYQELLSEIIGGGYDVVHCNTPIGGVLGRICGHKAKVQTVIYQAHGFHFWNGAPVKNWMIYYPVERLLAHWTDVLITINKEDYQRAKTFHLSKNGKLILHPGVGVNIQDFQNVTINREKKRAELGVAKDQIVFITVGELIDRKNHNILIEAMKRLNNKNAVLLIAGAGANADRLQLKIDSEGLNDSVKLLGYRTDVKELLKAADCFIFPSLQEGLPGALMEAMAAGLPCIASNIRGNTDALGDSEFMFAPNDRNTLIFLMEKMLNPEIRTLEAEKNKDRVKKFDISEAIKVYKNIYQNVLRDVDVIS